MLALLGCGSGGAEERNEPAAEVGTEKPLTETAPSFSDAPEVKFRGAQETASDSSLNDPNSCVYGIAREIPAAEARELGYDVDGDYEFLERRRTGDVLVAGEAVSKTTVQILGRVDHVWRVDRTPPSGVELEDATPSGCPPLVGYELTVQMFTEDGSISGVFLARTNAARLGETPELNIYAESDLRNFSGSLPVARDSSGPFFAEAHIQWYTAANDEFVFIFEPLIWDRNVDKDCIEPLCANYFYAGARLSYGVATRDMATLGELVSSLAHPNVSSLTELVAAMGPYRPNVRLWVVGLSSEPTTVQVRMRVNGQEVQAGPLALSHDPKILSPGAVGGWIDVGELDEAVPVEFEVENAAGLSEVRSHILIDGCKVSQAGDRCADPGCVARSAAIVSASSCPR